MAVSSFDVPAIGEESDFIRYIMGSNLTATFSGVFLVVFGLIAILISCMTILINRQFLRLMLSGAFSLNTGIWVLCYYNYVEIISHNAAYNSMLEFISLYLIPVWTMLFYAMIYSGRRKKAFLTLSFINIGFVVMVMFCHTVLAIHLNNFLLIFHLLALVEILFSFVIIAGSLKRRERLKRFQEKILLIGLIVFMLCSAADLVNYNLQKYLYLNFLHRNSVLFLPFGAVFFVVSLLMNYFYFIMDNTVQQKEKEQLLNIAYVDKLTQISNRTKCERDMKILEDGDKPYAIISFDLNHLKQVNDTYGHSMGDKLISGFATILDKCFGNIGTVGRMGGDEFIVMVSAQAKDTINQRLLAMEALLAKESRKDERLQFSSSYGTAYSADHPEMTAFQLYKLADSRMYEMKIRVEGPKVR
jgi:diguanylate cyclase (GGDEF)-like protein